MNNQESINKINEQLKKLSGERETIIDRKYIYQDDIPDRVIEKENLEKTIRIDKIEDIESNK